MIWDRKKIFYLLLAVFILALFLRLYQLDQESFWSDELSTLQYAQNLDNIDRGNPPLYYLFMNKWINLFGVSEFSMRLPSAILGASLVLLLYLVGKSLFNKKVALLSAFMCATSAIQIVYSQEARAYAMLSVLTLLCAYFFIRIIKTDKLYYYLFFILLTVLTIYLHFLGMALFIMFNILFIFFRKGHFRNWVCTQAIILGAIFPLLYSFLKVFVKLYQVDFKSIFSVLGIPLFVLDLLLLLSAIVLFLVMFYVIEKRKIIKIKFENSVSSLSVKIERNQKYFLIACLILGILFIGGYLFSLKYILTPYRMFLLRYALFMIPFVYLMVSFFLLKIKEKKYLAFFLIVILLLNSFSLCGYYSQPTKEEWREAANFIENNAKTNDVILFDAGYMVRNFDYYNKDAINNKNFSKILLLSSTDKEEMHTSFNSALSKLSSAQGSWLILSHNWRSEDFYKLQMDARYNLIQEKHYKDIDIYHYSGQQNQN
ncbi:MAG: glycosyltransferase family 39 protein [Nanoarchaeota archaeon]